MKLQFIENLKRKSFCELFGRNKLLYIRVSIKKRMITKNKMNRIADAFYDENYAKLSKLLGKKVSNLEEVELELSKW
jgi:hypothetical protein